MSSKARARTHTHERVDVAIVGAGFGGLCTAIKLLEAGNTSFVILEKASEVGGTWRENRYPGCACDVQSHLYSFSFEGNPNWSRRFASSPEIHDYIVGVVSKYGLERFIRFGRTVEESRFDESTGLWNVRATTGERVVARNLVLATGPLHVPSIPKIRGLDTFKGRVFHSAQWDQGYDLRGKRVASIGTGASAIQYVPQVAKEVARLDVYQRTPAWVVPRDERRYPGIAKALFAKVPFARAFHRAQLYLTNEARVLPMLDPTIARIGQKLGELHLYRQVRDPILRAKLTPDYRMGCKRVLISNDYYPTFTRDNVELVTEGIREIREHSIVTSDGVEREIDCVVLGTGFVTDPRDYLRGTKFIGRDGVDLRESWAKGAEAYYGITVAGFPNMFQLTGPNTGLGHNSMIFMIEAQVRYLLECMAVTRDNGSDTIEVRAETQRTFNESLAKRLEKTVWASGCQSWYQNADGRNFTIWPGTTIEYWLETRSVDKSAYVFRKAAKRDAAIDANGAEVLN